jgi:hypothetical protein
MITFFFDDTMICLFCLMGCTHIVVFFQSFAEKIQVLVFKLVRLTVFGTSLETCASGEKGQNLD